MTHESRINKSKKVTDKTLKINFMIGKYSSA